MQSTRIVMDSQVTKAKYFDLTQSQFLIWTGQQLNPESPMYNMAFAFELQGAIDEVVFKKAFSVLIQQCDAMRTVIEIKAGQPKQRILDEFPFELEVLDFSIKDNQRVFLKDWIKNRSQELFNLSTRLFDAVLIKVEAEKYIWFLNQHHLITDGWSKTVQYKKMAEIYGALSQGAKTISLPLYQEYLRFEKAKRLESKTNQSSNYWSHKTKILKTPPVAFGNGNKERKSSSQRISFPLSKEKSNALRALTAEPDLRAWTQDLSLFNIFSSLLVACLYRLSGEENLAIGIPLPNRPNIDFKKTTGLFTELFPLSVNVTTEDTFSTLFDKVREESFSCLKNAVVGKSSQTISKGFNVVLNYMNGSFDAFNGIPVKAEWIFVEHADPGHHLRLQIFDFNASGTIEISFDLNTSVFDAHQKTMILQQFSQLLDRFIEDRNQPINKLSFEELDFLNTFNKTDIVYPKDKTIIDLFEEQANKYPNKTAILFKEEKLTYRQLDQRANQLAAYLQQKGLKKEMLVGICLERSLEMIVSILAVAKAGGTYLPIDPDYPQGRIDYILEDSGLEIMISHSKFNEAFLKKNSQCIYLDTDKYAIEQEQTTQPKTNIQANNSLYIIYTSGSTGAPKGVVIEHRNVVRLFFNEQPLFSFNEKDTWTLFHSYCFDFSVWEMYGALLFGGTLVVVPKETSKDPEAFANLLKEREVSVLNQTPAAFYNLQDFYFSKNTKTSIRYLIFGGEVLAPARLKKWNSHYPDCHLINMYGITETTVHVTYRKLTKKDIDLGISNIGNAIPTLECLLLDENHQQLPLNIPGEIYVGGAGLARAYLNREKLTKEKFIPHPLNTDASARLYKTGDMGLRLSDGSIKYIGRLDDQVKIRGHRIEPGEIEATLNKHEWITQSAVLALADGTENKRLIAYVVADDLFNQGEIKRYLKQNLPSYMVPALVINLKALPLTSNGKIDKKALPEPDFNHLLGKNELKEATTEFEQIISNIWSEILQIERIDIHQNFFELGGDSLSSVRVMARVNEAFELELKVNLIFQKNTIADLSLEVEETIKKLLMEMESSEQI